MFAYVSLLSAATVHAQVDTPGEAGRFQFGPLRFTPWITVTDIGVDTNVFNETEDPKRDFTTALGPASRFWMNIGPSRVQGTISGQYQFFGAYDHQRSWATANEVRWDVPLARMTPFVTGAYNSTRQRPGYEIDTRARHRKRSYGLGADLRLSGKTSLVLSGTRTEFEFDEDDAFFGSTLAETLNRTSDIEELQLRSHLTPLTTFVVRAEAIQDRFHLRPGRDAQSLRVAAGFELAPQALISGTGFVGFRSFSPRHASVPSYRGIVASVKAQHTVAATRFEVQVARDLDYSFETTQPYYALTDVNVTVTERLSHLWDVLGRAGWQSLGYRSLAGTGDGDARVDRGAVYGTGVGYRIGQFLRIGFDLNYFRRDTRSTSFNDYSGLRVGGSVTYGKPQ